MAIFTNENFHETLIFNLQENFAKRNFTTYQPTYHFY